ncbi:MAG: hypothetical protein EBR82_88870, partial [Caulobacteraceae bacterium]|nr:hypothetical protein [Caulobacteraceae bacterium]
TLKPLLNIVMSMNNISTEAIKIAYFKGYRVANNGSVISPHGKIRKCTLSTPSSCGSSYFRFNVGIGNKKVYPIYVHRLIAYQKFGDRIFEEEIEVRHLDGNSTNNNISNIELGTKSDNEMDRKKNIQSYISSILKRRKYPESLIESIKRDYKNGLGYRKLNKKYSIPISTLSYYLSNKSKRSHWKPSEEAIKFSVKC